MSMSWFIFVFPSVFETILDFVIKILAIIVLVKLLRSNLIK